MNVQDHDSARAPGTDGRGQKRDAASDARPGSPHRQQTSPETVVQDPGLSRQEKLCVLKDWARDEWQIAVAVQEGMPGSESELLQRILNALDAAQRL